jgi:hypothetical protein
MAKKPTVADLMAEIEVLKRKVAALEIQRAAAPLQADPARKIEQEMLEALRRAADRAEKERLTRPEPVFPWRHPIYDQPHWLSDPTRLRAAPWPDGTIIC